MTALKAVMSTADIRGANTLGANLLDANLLGGSPFWVDAQACRVRTQRALGASTAIHILLLSWLVLLPHGEPEVPAVTEITFLEPGELSPGGSIQAGPSLSAPAPPARRGGAIGQESPGLAVAANTEVRFRRDVKEAALTPEPQSEHAFADRLEARLVALQRDVTAPTTGVPAATLSPAPLWGSAPISSTGSGSGGKAPIELNRGGTGVAGGRGGGSGEGVGKGHSSILTRGGGGGGAPQLAVPLLPSASAQAAKPPSAGKAASRRDLAGMSIMGPIADRPIVSYTAASYPEWAKSEGVEGSVTLYFVVLPDGRVKENIVVQKTAGFEDFDENASAALRTWLFEPLRRGETGDQWGTITVHFRLRDVR